MVALFVDVRGFTSFAGITESTDTAEFLKAMYTSMLKDDFPDCEYFKLTGDGMMVIYHFEDEESLLAQVRNVITKSLALVERFPTITRGIRMIDFPVPTRLGIGVARGSATLIATSDATIDYTGRPLNLAARLMDLARPSGIVIESSLGIDVLDEAIRGRFAPDQVYITGIAEEASLAVFYLKDHTEISDYSKLPIKPPIRFVETPEKLSLRELQERGARFQQRLSQEPARTDDALVHLAYPKAKADGNKSATARWTPSRKVEIVKRLNQWHAEIDYTAICKELSGDRCKSTWPVEITLEYTVRDTTPDQSSPTQP